MQDDMNNLFAKIRAKETLPVNITEDQLKAMVREAEQKEQIMKPKNLRKKIVGIIEETLKKSFLPSIIDLGSVSEFRDALVLGSHHVPDTKQRIREFFSCINILPYKLDVKVRHLDLRDDDHVYLVLVCDTSVLKRRLDVDVSSKDESMRREEPLREDKLRKWND